MGVRWVTRPRCEPYKHADPTSFQICREQLAFDVGCNLIPLGFGPLARPWEHEWPSAVRGNASRKAGLQRCIRMQYVLWPGRELGDESLKALQFPLAKWARSDMTFRRNDLVRRQRLSRIGTCRF